MLRGWWNTLTLRSLALLMPRLHICLCVIPAFVIPMQKVLASRQRHLRRYNAERDTAALRPLRLKYRAGYSGPCAATSQVDVMCARYVCIHIYFGLALFALLFKRTLAVWIGRAALCFAAHRCIRWLAGLLPLCSSFRSAGCFATSLLRERILLLVASSGEYDNT